MDRYRVALAGAAFCAATWASRHGFAVIVLVAVVACAAVFVALDRPRLTARVTIAIAAAAGSLYAIARPDAVPIAEGPTSSYRAVVMASEDSPIDGLRSVNLRIASLTVEALVPAPGPLVGATIVVRGRLEPPDVARNPGEPSPRDLARDRGIDGSLERAHLIAVGDVDTRDVWLWLPRVRAWAGDRVRSRLDEPYASILTGALFGERSALPKALRDEFQETGTTHILVTAGLHLGVIAALAFFGLKALGCGRISASLASIGVVWAYAELSGAHVPSVRAATMISIALVARACGRKALSWNALGLAAIVTVLLHPWSVDGVSFALSFSCVGAIVLFAEPLQAALARLRLPHAFREAVGLTIATQIGTWPLTAATFLVIAPYSPLANLAIVPVMGVVLAGGLALMVCGDAPVFGQGLANLETSLLAGIVTVVATVGAWPGARIVATPPPAWTIAAYDAAIATAAVLLRRGRGAAAGGVVVAACALCTLAPRGGGHDLEITVLDVGQADAIVVRTPAGHVFLVDAGGRLERGMAGGDSQAEAVGERIVVPYLLRRGIRHIDAILMTHPHGDHVAGAPPVIRDLDVTALADSGQAYPGHGYRETLRLARERSLPVLEPRGGDVWHTDDGVALRFYAPTLPYITGSRSDINSNSLVFRLEYRAFRMLFTGDAGAETEARLLAAHDDLRADVLKVGHHGSAYGTTDAFVRAVSPRFAVISVGRHNLFGHPALSTLTELDAHRVKVFRTDRDGAVTTTVDADGTIVRVDTVVARGDDSAQRP